MQLGVRPVLVGRRNSLMSEFRSLHLLHGLGAVADAQGDAPGGAAKPVVLGVQAATSGTRGMGNPAAVKSFCRAPVGGLATGRCGGHAQASRQAKHCAHRASSCSCHVTKRFRILATLKQGNKSMYNITSGYVHMGLRLDWG